jgi:hypothetical protein
MFVQAHFSEGLPLTAAVAEVAAANDMAARRAADELPLAMPEAGSPPVWRSEGFYEDLPESGSRALPVAAADLPAGRARGAGFIAAGLAGLAGVAGLLLSGWFAG